MDVPQVPNDRTDHRLLISLTLLALLLLLPGHARALPGEVLDEHKISSTTGGLVGPLTDNDQFGISVTGIGDLDQDGVEDVAVGALNDDDGGTDRGAVWILFMNANGSVKSEQKISDTSGGFTGALTDTANFGGTVELLGDINGDGINDIAVGAHGDDAAGSDRGAVWILFLESDGTVKDEQLIMQNEAGFNGIISDGDFFGLGIAAIGDLDGNGTTELAVGAYGDDDGGTGTGSVWILFLLPDGTVHHFTKISETFGNLGVDLDPADRFGIRVAAIGDLNNDGVVDLAVSADLDDDGGGNRGAVYVLFLEHDGTVETTVKISDTSGNFNGAIEDSDTFGSGLAAIGDVNGDGFPDLAVGALGDDDGGAEHGAVWILFMLSNGSVADLQKISDLNGTFGGVLGADRFGVAVSGLGDVDGDGIVDLAVGGYTNDDGGNNRGSVWILELDGTAIACGNSILDPIEECDDGNTNDFDGCTASCELEDDLELFGTAETTGLVSVEVNQHSVNASVLTGDSPALLAQLLAIGINGNSSLSAIGTTAQSSENTLVCNGTFNDGAIYADGTALSINPGQVIDEQKISNTQGGFTGSLMNMSDFGSAVTSLGDLDGDGVEDLAVGDRSDDDGGNSRGAVWILFLNPDRTVKSHQKISGSEGGFQGLLQDFDGFGEAVEALGDLDGDGVVDLAVGAPLDSDPDIFRGAVWILFLDTDGTVKSHQKINHTTGGFSGALASGDGFGTSLASAGDHDGDGVVDLYVGAPGDDDGFDDYGAVWLLYLNVNGTVKTHQQIGDAAGGLTGPLGSGGQFGWGVTSIGDLDDDGVTDLAVGAITDEESGQESGAVWIVFMNADGTVKSDRKINYLSGRIGGFKGAITEGDHFGTSVAYVGDVDGDGVGDLAVGADFDDDEHQLASGTGNANGALWVLFMNTDGSVKGHWKISDTQGGFAGVLDPGDLFGASVTPIGDLAFDGYLELAVGAVGDDDGANSPGAVWILTLDSASLSYCGDGVVVLPESCDDGGTTPGDGCYSTCEPEDEIEFTGTAQGGTVQVVLSGVTVLIGTSSGQSASTVASNLSGVINIVPALETMDVSSAAIAERVVSNGTFDEVVINDPGITLVPEPGVALMLGVGSVFVHALHRRRRSLATR